MHLALAHSHPNTFGGGEQALLQLARGLGEAHGVRLLVGRYAPGSTYPELAEWPRQELGPLDWLISDCPDDVVIANSFGANLLALRNGRRVVYWVHSVRSRFLLPHRGRPDLVARRVLDWMAVRRSARVIANSQFTAGRIRRLYGRNADAVVYPGVDLDRFRPSQRGAQDRATYVGRLAPEKGIERLLAVWRHLPEHGLDLVGDGEPGYVERLRRQAPGNVTFRGALPPDEVANAFRSARVAVMASYREEFGLAALEAMASGVPVVAFGEGGLREVVEDGVSGYLVDDEPTFVTSVRRLFEEDGLRRTMARAARVRAEGFSWGRTVAAMNGHCREIAGG